MFDKINKAIGKVRKFLGGSEEPTPTNQEKELVTQEYTMTDENYQSPSNILANRKMRRWLKSMTADQFRLGAGERLTVGAYRYYTYLMNLPISKTEKRRRFASFLR